MIKPQPTVACKIKNCQNLRVAAMSQKFKELFTEVFLLDFGL